MLKKIYLRNIVLIDEMKISLSDGLHVFTGETGAGKSILLEGLGLALGARANFGLIGIHKNNSEVKAEFIISKEHPIVNILNELNISYQENLIYLLFHLKPMSNIVKPDFSINREVREQQKKQKGVVLWFTGLSASGKTTTANELDKLLLQNHNHSYILDGDVFRSGLSSDLSFDKKSREENLRRIRHVAELFCDAGIVTIVTFISPFESDRQKARALLKEKYIEIFVKVSIGVAEKRDPKGLYKLAREGKISNFTGISSPYEEPKNPEIELNTEFSSPKDCAQMVFDYLKNKKLIDMMMVLYNR